MSKWEIIAKDANAIDLNRKAAVRYMDGGSDSAAILIQKILVDSYADRIMAERTNGR